MTVTLLVLDSVGVGSLPDADEFGDHGAHTLDHTLGATGVQLPGFQKLGLGNIEGVTSITSTQKPHALHGRLLERSPGKDTTTGHWEFMGVVLEHAFHTFQRFPVEVMEAFDRVTGVGHLGNHPASGTEIIEELGRSHLESGSPIVYTSADSVFQIAAHVDVVPLETLYHWCEKARGILQGKHAVARVIARPFRGTPGNFVRVAEDRKDFSLPPPQKTVLEVIEAAGKEVIGLGKIPDIYSHRGFTKEIKTGSNTSGIDKTIQMMKQHPNGLVFCNLVEFDSLYGHRRDPFGYAEALREVDSRLEDLVDALRGDDVLMFVSDHGNDPTWPGTDHTREYGLLLALGPHVTPCQLGTRSSFADVGASVAELLDIEWQGEGKSFASLLRR
jgi:phosphopentomutase